MWIEEKGVHSPWEGFCSLVQVLVGRRIRKLTIVLRTNMVQVCVMFNLGVVDPCDAYGDWNSIRM
jgi:hypothetical protein